MSKFRRRQAATLALFLGLLASAGAGQMRFSKLGKRHFPSSAEYLGATGAVFVDVDGDRDLDLFVGTCPPIGFFCAGQNRLYLNDGAGRYSEATERVPRGMSPTTAVAAGDVDGDGDQDLIVCNLTQSALWLNDGKGRFTDVTATNMPKSVQTDMSVATGDVDGDGDLDLVFGGSSSRLYLNSGKGRFTDATTGRLPEPEQAYDAALVDLDGDGDLDLVLCGDPTPPWNGPARAFLNDGKGRFSLWRVNLPAAVHAVAAGDVDGDRDVDLIFAALGLQNRLFLNEGKGRFTDVSATHLPARLEPTSSVALVDADGDRDVDLVVANLNGRRDRLLSNNGKGRFVDSPELPRVEDGTVAVAVGDVDADGDPDLFMVSTSPRLFLNDGAGRFADGSATPSTDFGAELMVAGDVDGDGDLDMVLGGLPNRLLLGKADGGFVDATTGKLPQPGARTYALALGDVDGDKDLDVLLTAGFKNRLYLNDGNGTFTDATAGRLPTRTHHGSASILLADIDGDADLDALVSGRGIDLYLNDGAGKFTDATARLPKSAASVGAAGDVDGDGDLDLIGSGLFLNVGNGRFTDATKTHWPDRNKSYGVTSMTFGDIDGDGDIDLILGRGRMTLSGQLLPMQIHLHRNNGKGVFTDATAALMPKAEVYASVIAAVDVDEDGDLDLFCGNKAALSVTGDLLLVNDGKGRFVDATASHVAGRETLSAATADIDHDGDTDLLLASYTGTAVWFNLERQVHAPYLAVLGRDWQLDYYAKATAAPAGQIVIPLLSGTRARTRVRVPPFGWFGLGPTGLVAMPAVSIPAKTGKASVKLTIPKAPGLAGAKLYVQALVLHRLGPSPWRFTNVASDVVLRG